MLPRKAMGARTSLFAMDRLPIESGLFNVWANAVVIVIIQLKWASGR
jgi:hypothetical protein